MADECVVAAFSRAIGCADRSRSQLVICRVNKCEMVGLRAYRRVRHSGVPSPSVVRRPRPRVGTFRPTVWCTYSTPPPASYSSGMTPVRTRTSGGPQSVSLHRFRGQSKCPQPSGICTNGVSPRFILCRDLQTAILSLLEYCFRSIVCFLLTIDQGLSSAFPEHVAFLEWGMRDRHLPTDHLNRFGDNRQFGDINL